jgi:4-amino-4-deoxy-L-arabinose transferase-like glycosyltransferase
LIPPPRTASGVESLSRPTVAVVLGIAFAARVLWALVVPVQPISDSMAYDTFARSLAAGDGYGWNPNEPSAYWPVGTSGVYAALYAVFGLSYVPLVVLHVLLGTASVLFTMLLTARWFGRRAAVCAGALFAVWPSQVEFTTVLASEPIFVFLVLLALWHWSRPAGPSWGRLVGVGVALGLASLVRPQALLIPVVFGGVELFRRSPWKTVLARTAVVSVVLLAVILPWSIRNYRVFDTFVLISTNGGTNLWMGNNPDTDGTFMALPKRTDGMSEPERDRTLKQEAVRHIKSEPVRFASRTVSKLVRLHDRETIGLVWNPGFRERFGSRAEGIAKAVSTAFWLAVLGLAIVGGALLFRRSGVLGFLGAMAPMLWLYFALTHAVIVIQDRYHFPSIPFIASLAGVSLAALLDLRDRRSNVRAVGAPPVVG